MASNVPVQSRRVLATLIRLMGDFDLAEEALHDAFRAALEQWPRDGLPANPRAWLVSAGRFKTIDAIRRRARFDAVLRVIYLVFGDLILLENQDRSLWNRDQIEEGLALVERALSSRRFGPYTLQNVQNVQNVEGQVLQSHITPLHPIALQPPAVVLQDNMMKEKSTSLSV